MEDSARATVNFSAQPFDLAFHASSDVVAVGLVDGRLQLLRYGGGGGGGGGAAAAPSLLLELPPHADAVRSLAFSPDGTGLFSGSTDRSVRRTDAAGRVSWQARGAHEATVTRVAPFGEGAVHLVASGDENGIVKVWDCRVAAGSAGAAAAAVGAAAPARIITVAADDAAAPAY